jgi:hypothetical protein
LKFRITNLRDLLLLAFLFLALAPASHAACTSPAGAAGDVVYNSDYHVPEYCNNVTWVAMAPPVNVPPTNGLIGYWKLDDGSGTSAIDSSGNNNAGTLQNSSTWTNGYYNGALTLNGTNSYVSVPSAASITSLSNFTYAVWVYPYSNGAFPGGAIFSKNDKKYMRMYYGSLNASVVMTGVNPAVNTSSLTLNTWQHLAMTFDSATVTVNLYKNGVLLGSSTGTGSPQDDSAGSLFLGNMSTADQGFNGLIDDARIYNRALSAAEVATLYNWHIYPPATGLAGYWKFDESAGTVAADSSGSGNTGTTLNGPSFTSAGKLAGAVTLNGTNQGVSVSGMFGSPAAVTLSAWANLTGDTTNGSELISLGDCAGIRLDAGGSNTNTEAFYHVSAMWNIYSSNIAYVGTGWHHFAFVVNPGASSEAFYVDGVPVAAGANNTAILYNTGCGGNTYIGIHGNGDGLFPFKGKIDDARVYTRALSADEVYGLYRTGSPVCSGPTGYEGDVAYNAGTHHVMQFCDNAGWRPLGPVPGAGGGGCSSPAGAEGNMIYNDTGKGSGWMQYCDGTNWIQLGGLNPPTSGLALYLKFDDGSGTTAADSSGNGNNFAVNAGSTWIAGRVGSGALTFDGTSGSAGLFTSAVDLTGNRTLAAWIRTTNSTRSEGIITDYSASGSGQGYIFDDNAAGHLIMSFGGDNGGGYLTDTGPVINDGKWHQVVAVITLGVGVSFYIDGVLSSVQAQPYLVAGATNYWVDIGVCSYTPYGYNFTGSMDDVRIYNRALSAAEIWQLYVGTQ